jgi:hypothetical protein
MDLWREDIAEIVSVFREATSDGEVKIQTDKYEVDDIEDLGHIKEPRIERLVVTGDQGRLRLELSRSECQVEVTEPDLKARGMLAEILRISENYKPRPPRLWLILTLPIPLAFAALVLIVAQHLGIYNPDPELSSSPAVSGLLSGVVLALSTVGYAEIWYRKRFKVTILRTRTRAEAPTFWMRKREDIWIEIAVGSASLLLGGVIGYWINTIT